jgi:hypothetical protein
MFVEEATRQEDGVVMVLVLLSTVELLFDASI